MCSKSKRLTHTCTETKKKKETSSQDTPRIPHTSIDQSGKKNKQKSIITKKERNTQKKI